VSDEHIGHLARKYMGVDRYPRRTAGEQRLIIRVDPHFVRVRGG
jgi:hypothetical protein